MQARIQDSTPGRVVLLTVHFFVLGVTAFLVASQIADLVDPPVGVSRLQLPWELGLTLVLKIVAMIALIVIAWYSRKGVSGSGRWFYVTHAAWLLILTWYGWFSASAIFVVREVEGLNLRAAWMSQQLWLLIRFLLIAILSSGIPLWIFLRGGLRRGNQDGAPLRTWLKFVPVISIVSVVFSFLLVLGSTQNTEGLLALAFVAFGSSAFSAARRLPGSLTLLFIQACVLSLIRFLNSS